MSKLRLHADTLRQKAEEAGDSTNYAISRRSGVRESTLSRLFAGHTTPTVPTLVALRDAYGIQLDDLITGAAEDEKAPAA